MAETSSKFPIKTESQTAAPMAGPAWPPFDNLRREIDRVFDSFHRGWPFPFPRSSFDFDLPSRRLAGWNVAPAVDVTEREKDYEITAELPGLDEKDIEVKVANGVLTIKGEKKDEKEEKQKDYYLSERRYGSFLRSFQLPEAVDEAKIEAGFAKGVLTVRLPKSAKAQEAEKTIPIKAA
jgi:HSP20 family protein